MSFTRRRLFGGLISAPVLLTGCVSPRPEGLIKAGCQSSSGLPEELPSRDLIQTLVRMRGDLRRHVWLWFEGRVYGKAPEDVIRPLFGFTSVLRVRYDAMGGDAVRFSQRESAHYTSLETGEPAGEFYNPYTDRTNIAVGYVSPLFTYELRPQGTWSTRSSKQIGYLDPAIKQDMTHVWTTEYRANEFPASIDADEFPNAFRTRIRKSADVATYRVRTPDLRSSKAFVPATTDVIADTPWPLWMFMGARPGNVIWIGHGAKVLTLQDLPGDMCRRVEMVHPGFLNDPWELDASRYSTAYQMRALRAAGRI